MDQRDYCRIEEGLTRKLLSIRTDGVLMQGTVHYGPAFSDDIKDRCGNEHRVGILFLNPGYLPRSARGDLYVRMADQLARNGHLVFRFDLPGLGESPGDLPENVLPFFVKVQTGQYAQETSLLVQEIVRQFGLQGLVLAGICGGAVTALFAAQKCIPGMVTGLVLLDPTFKTFSAQPAPQAPRTGIARVWSDAWGRIRAMNVRIRAKVVRTEFGERMSVAYALIKKAARILLLNRLPANSNMALIRCWREQAVGGMPILVFNADSEARRLDEYDYSSYLLKGASRNTTWVTIEETNHSFLEGKAPEVLQEHITQWLATHFSNMA
jgi:alpha-beta hydrolase superfamily lysophospholipase